MSTLSKIVSRWGLFEGLKFYYEIKRNKKRTWTLDELKHPVHLRAHTSDNLVFKQIFGMGEYDIRFPFEPKNIIDGGGNIGLFAIIMANRYPNARIISIEPDAGNFAQLVKNTAPYPNIIPIHAGLWHKPCDLEIVDDAMDEWGLQVRETEDEHGMQAITIGALMETYNMPTIDVVKLDVEGAEAAIFSDNYHNWMSKTRILI
ncbi:MAG TPA: FkbM family methyltransferase, partial [Phnomibacter sp.]|nr:FkbM family methyltransferase [Phnomibacter sp.]